MQDFLPNLETMSRRARRTYLRDLRIGREFNPNVVNTFIHGQNSAADTNAGPSPAVWRSCPQEDFRAHFDRGYIFQPDLRNAPKFATTVSQLGLITLQDTGVLIQGDPTQSGVLQWSGQDADNDAGVITAAGGVGTSFVVSDSDARELWFEIGLRKSTIANNGMAFFAGLTEEAMNAATNTLLATDTAALADKDLIGFHVTQAAGATVTFVYNKAGAGGVTVKIASLATMVAATWIKLGFWYKPDAPTGSRIRIFVNNVENATHVTGTNTAAATFPGGEELVPTIVTKVGTVSLTDTFDVRLWRAAQKIS